MCGKIAWQENQHTQEDDGGRQKGEGIRPKGRAIANAANWFIRSLSLSPHRVFIYLFFIVYFIYVTYRKRKRMRNHKNQKSQ
jgi:hypothetical protein